MHHYYELGQVRRESCKEQPFRIDAARFFAGFLLPCQQRQSTKGKILRISEIKKWKRREREDDAAAGGDDEDDDSCWCIAVSDAAGAQSIEMVRFHSALPPPYMP